MSELTGRSVPKFEIGEDIYWQCGGRWYAGYVVGWRYECAVSCIPVISYCLNVFGIGNNIEISEYDEERIRHKPKFQKGDKVLAEMTYFGVPVVVKATITSDAHDGPGESATEWEYSIDDGVVNRTFKESQLWAWRSDYRIPYKYGTTVSIVPICYKLGSQVDVMTYFGCSKAYYLKKGTVIGACVACQYGFKYLIRYENGDIDLVAKDRIRALLLGKNTCMCYIDEYMEHDLSVSAKHASDSIAAFDYALRAMYMDRDAAVTKEVCDKIHQGGKEKMDDKELKTILEAAAACPETMCWNCALEGDTPCENKLAEATKEVLRRMEEKEKQEAKFGDGINLNIKLRYPREPKVDFQQIICDVRAGKKPLVGFKGERMKMWMVAAIADVRQRVCDNRWEFVSVNVDNCEDDCFGVDETCEVVLWENGYTGVVYCKKDFDDTAGNKLIRGKKYVIYNGQIHNGDVWGPVLFASSYIRDENDEFMKEYFTVPTGRAINVETYVKKPELLNGTALCTESCAGFTEGTLYKFINGKTIDDDGDIRPKNTSIHTTDPDWLLSYRLIMLK